MNTSMSHVPMNATSALDPNVKQRIASDPSQSVWVDASAGTGKTKILTDRVLRLLLSEDDRPASTPERIVCITFTKAAAAEMSLRITKKLSEWATANDEILNKNLTDLLGKSPNRIQIKEARTLFARVIDVPGGLKIMTIHAFCQSILQKFPLEAGLSPNFTVFTDIDAKDAIQKARHSVLSMAKNEPHSALGQAVRNLSIRSDEASLLKFLESGLTEKEQMHSLFKRFDNLDDIKHAIYKECGFESEISVEKLIEQFYDALPQDDIKNIISGYEKGTNKEQEKVLRFVDNLYDVKRDIDDYCDLFLTQKDKIRSPAATKKVLEYMPEIEFTFIKEAERCLDFKQARARLMMAQDTYDFLCVSHAILDAYTDQKTKQNAVDFDDLIDYTHQLLSHSQTAAQWVLFKLDQGLDHLLVDEAQDTNPSQWKVIEALSNEFFHGQSARDDIARTIFVVGDEKQSIYSFQKADPEIFRKMQLMFKDKIKDASKAWEDVRLTLSFRSTDAVLALVDQVFSSQDMKQALTAQATDIEHLAFRTGQAGHVELWPIIDGEEAETLEPWPIPRTPTGQSNASNLMAQKIAGTIKHWLDTKKPLASQDRPIEAGDIMILLKRRSAFQKTLVRALKDYGIAVGGLDRLVLQDHIAVKDVLALLTFGLLPQDNLTLATVLKSPLIDWSEDQLMDFILANQKATSLWVALREHAPKIYSYLLNIHDLTLKKRTFDVVSHILNSACPVDGISGYQAFLKRLGDDALDPLHELLNSALDTENEKGLSVQSFVHRMQRDEKEIKREMEDDTNAVRIMTVHGSKGLQAPIVFLPDTLRHPNSRDNSQQAQSKLLWPRRSGLELPFWAPRAMPDMFKEAKDEALARDDREYQRLLYVALTRASDELYICGYRNKENTKTTNDSWHHVVTNAVEQAVETGVRAPCTIQNKDGTYIISNPQTKAVDPKHKKRADSTDGDMKLPVWALSPPKKEPTPSRPLQPSRPSGEIKSLSPLAGSTDHRYKRGNIIHTILEFLPDIAPEKQYQSCVNFLSQPGHGLSTAEQKNIAGEVIKILQDPVFSPVFGKHSKAEVSISGLINENTIINGQIDRLIITDTEIFIVDYKTNRPAAKTREDVPDQYIKQLQSYEDVLSSIYPNHKIKKALLWTNIPLLMEL